MAFTHWSETPFGDFQSRPHPLKLAFRDCIYDHVALRASEIPMDAEKTIFIKQDSNVPVGSGYLGVGTEQFPYRASGAFGLKLIQNIINADAASSLLVRFHRGDRWFIPSGIGFEIDRDNVRVNSYGDANSGSYVCFHGTEPVANYLNVATPTGVAIDDNKYLMTINTAAFPSGSQYGFIHDWGNNPETCTGKVYHIVNSDNTTGNLFKNDYCMAHTTAGVNYYFAYNTGIEDSTDPDLHQKFRVQTHTGGSLFLVRNRDGCRIEDVAAIGCSDWASQDYGIRSEVGTVSGVGNKIIIRNCLAQMCGRHAMGNFTTNSGGLIVYQDNIIGCCKHTGADVSAAVCYAGDGEHEAIYDNNIVTEGYYVNLMQSSREVPLSVGLYAHTVGGGTEKLALFMATRNHINMGFGGAGGASDAGDLRTQPTWASGDNVDSTGMVGFVVDEVIDCRRYRPVITNNNHYLSRVLNIDPGILFINYKVKNMLWEPTEDTDQDPNNINIVCEATTSNTYTNSQGWVINSDFEQFMRGTGTNGSTAYMRNNSEPNTTGPRQYGGSYTHMWYSRYRFTAEEGCRWNVSSFSNHPVWQVFGNVDGDSNDHMERTNNGLSWCNCVIEFEDYDGQIEPFVFGCGKADPVNTGTLFTTLGTGIWGGASYCGFFNFATGDVPNVSSQRTNFGIQHFLDNTNCFEMNAATPTGDGVRPNLQSEIVGKSGPLPPHANNQRLEYDIDWNPRRVSGAIGPYEAEGAVRGVDEKTKLDGNVFNNIAQRPIAKGIDIALGTSVAGSGFTLSAKYSQNLQGDGSVSSRGSTSKIKDTQTVNTSGITNEGDRVSSQSEIVSYEIIANSGDRSNTGRGLGTFRKNAGGDVNL